MNKLQHTPGPWESAGGDDSSYEINIGESTAFIARYDKNTGAMVFSRDEMEANARLIAAAPEMLDTLLREYELFKNIYDMGLLMLGTQMQEKFERSLEIKKSAIERATGLPIEEVLR